MSVQSEESLETQELQNEDLEIAFGKIAEQLSELSAVEAKPVGFKIPNDPFEANDVDFSSSAWLLRILQVQVWLNPNSEVERKLAESDPAACARSMFSAIAAESPSQCIEVVDGVVKLTTTGAEYLASRLDTAISLQHAFQESLETVPAKQATDQWIELWEAAEEPSGAFLEPIKAKSDTWRISDFSGKASRDNLNLTPSYQRGDVWPTRDAQKLIESILRGIPLPSIILLRPAIKGKQTKSMYEVVDGKQRLTSILRFIGKHPKAIERVKEQDKKNPRLELLRLFNTDYKKFRRAWKNLIGEPLTDKREAEYYFPFRLAKNSAALKGTLANLAGKYFCEISDEMIHVGEGMESVGDVFQSSSDYKIPLIEYTDASPAQIHEVFHLYNRQGVHLNAEEIRNALFHDVDLVRLVLVASGDNPSARMLAPYFPEAEYQLFSNISRCLTDYRFGTARYKRTKLLSWLYALLFQPSEENGELTIRSTAKQIDSLLSNSRPDQSNAIVNRLASKSVLISLIRATDQCLDAHSSVDCWDARFKDDEKGQKWQELQLVASLVAVFLIGVVEKSPDALLERFRDELLKFTRGHRRPEKTQNKTQWAYIGEVALGILTTVRVDEKSLEDALMDRYGVSCLPTLKAAKALYKARTEE